ncbi:MAG: hypothetical protein JO108_06450 [Acidobacteriaceae bacterium]|nr:hypothetical protein [Acidobacteriaceae bacterium]
MPEVATGPGKIKITLKLDTDIIDHFRQIAHQSGGSVTYKRFINTAPHEYIEGRSPKFEDTLRRILREELRSAHDAA